MENRTWGMQGSKQRTGHYWIEGSLGREGSIKDKGAIRTEVTLGIYVQERGHKDQHNSLHGEGGGTPEYLCCLEGPLMMYIL